MDSSETPNITEETSVVNMMSSYTALLKKSASIREKTEDDEVAPTIVEEVIPEEPAPVEEEIVEEEIVEEEIVEEPAPADPLSSLFSELEQVFVEGAEAIGPPPAPEPIIEEIVEEDNEPVSKDALESMFSDFEQLFTAAKPLAEPKKKPTVESIQTKVELESFFSDLESMFTEEPEEEPEPIIEQVDEPEPIVEEVVFEPAPVEPIEEESDPMSQYTSLLKSSATIREPEVQEDIQYATVADLNKMTQQLMNNIQKSLTSLGGGGLGEMDVMRIVRKYNAETLGLDSAEAPFDGGGADE